MSKPESRDLSAALTGLVLGMVSLFLIVTTIVLLTNSQHKNEKAAHGPAVTKH